MRDEAEEQLRQPGSPTIVELVGVPGAGKSTLAALLAPETGAVPAEPGHRPVRPAAVLGTLRLPLGRSGDAVLRGLRDRLPSRASAIVASLLWRAPSVDPLAVLSRTHPEYLALVAHAPPPSEADASYVLQWRSWPVPTMATHLALRRVFASGRSVLVEEGLVMRANTVCAGDPSLVDPYLRHQPVPDVLVVLHVDPATALDRIGGRDKRTLLRHEGLSADAVLEDLARSARLVASAGPILRERGVTVVDIDATEPPQRQQERVLEALAPEGRDAR